MRLIIFCVLLLFCLNINYASTDSYTKKNAPKKAVAQYEKAVEEQRENDVDKAIKILNKITNKYPYFVDPYIKLGDLYDMQNNPERAIFYYDKAVNLDSLYKKELFMRIAKMYIDMDQYKLAADYLKRYVALDGVLYGYRLQAERYLANTEFAIKAMENPVPFNPQNLGDSINTKEDELFPAITADEQTLIYTAKKYKRTGFDEDIMISQRGDSTWRMYQNLGKPINTNDNEGALTISPDGKSIYFTACNRKDGKGSCDIYYTQKIGNKWLDPVNIGEPINTDRWESQPSISSDGKTLYFTSDRPNGKGRRDIWVSHKEENGQWSEPENLGDKINTLYDDQCPFIHPDNRTLYFSSDGHIGMGEADILMTQRGADGKWPTPQNLGYPINTKENETSLVVSANGKNAYFASSRYGTKGNLDLYTFELSDTNQPYPVTYVKGVVTDHLTGVKLDAKIQLIDLKTGKLAVETNSDVITGEYLVCLLSGRDYALNIAKRNYLFHSENFSLSENMDPDVNYNINVALHPIKAGEHMVLKNIFYQTNHYELMEESKVELNKLVSFLNDYPAIKILITGHTDNVGDYKYNLALSNDRAKAVYTYLIQNDISPARLKYKGLGSNKPIADNKTAEGRSVNRRTEVEILGN